MSWLFSFFGLFLLFLSMACTPEANHNLEHPPKIVSDLSAFPELQALDSARIAAEDTGSTYRLAEICEQIGTALYQLDPRQGIRYFKAAAYYYQQQGNLDKAALCLQNIAFSYEEKLGEPEKALPFAEAAVTKWRAAGEPLQEANMLKYLGLLQGQTGQFEAAKRNLFSAVSLFHQNNHESGVAVSHFNLAHLYLEASQFDSCAYYLQQARSFWIKQQSPLRLFLINNAALQMHLEQENREAAKAPYRENLAWLSKIAPPRQAKEKFFTLCLEYFTQTGQPDSFSVYQSKLRTIRVD